MEGSYIRYIVNICYDPEGMLGLNGILAVMLAPV